MTRRLRAAQTPVGARFGNREAWDPAFAGELAIILDAGMREMLALG